MEIVIVWFVGAIIAGVIAHNKGRSGTGIFILSILLSPLIGILAALALSANNREIEEREVASGASKKCPYCAEIIKAEAIVCRYCGRDLAQPSQPTLRWSEGSEPQPLLAPLPDEKWGKRE